MSKTVHHQDLKSFFGDEDHLELSQKAKFSDLIFECLSGNKPSPSQSQIFELILNLSIDHGPDTPSAVEVINWANNGETISDAVAAGVQKIDDRHGGAIEPAMEVFCAIKEKKISPEDLVKNYLAEGKPLAGFGHRIYKNTDPRADLILSTLQKLMLGAEFIDVAASVSAELEKQKGKRLPLNIDGAIAVALCDFGWEPKLGKAVFLSARVPGLAAHYLNNSI